MSEKSSKRKASDDLEYRPPRMRKLSSDVVIKDEPVYHDESPSKSKDDDHLDQTMDTSELELEEKVDTKPEWVEDNTVPAGWKRRIFENNAMFHFNIPGVLAPDGNQYRSRQNALRVLIKKQADPELLSELSDCLAHEGWEEHELLPEGWRLRKQKKEFHRTKIEFLNHKAEMFKSLKETVEYMENNYEAEAVSSFQSLVELSSVEMRVEGYDWRPHDSVPPGWQMRLTEGPRVNKEFFLSPDGKMFATRTVALQHMIREEYHETEVELMRAKLVEHENWQTCPDLPAGWIMKDAGNFTLLTSEGDTLESWCSAMEYIKASQSYTHGDEERLRKAMEEKSKEKRLEGYEWEEDDTVPPGWRSRRAQSKTEKQYFLSPQGLSFASRFVAYQHMVREEFPTAETQEMRQCLYHENWEDSPLLPEQWKFKKSSTKTEVHFLTEEGEFLRNFKIARKRITGQLPECLDSFDAFQQNQSEEKRLEGYEWEEDDTVPPGWRSRRAQSKTEKQYFLSPQGLSFASRFVAYQHMVKEGFPVAETQEMRQCLCHEDWEDNPLLPDQWKFKRSTSRTEVHFLTDEGKFLRNFKIARELVTVHLPDCLENFDAFQQHESVRRRTFGYDWTEDDPTVPEGWMIRVNEGRTRRTFLLSPEGVQYQSRRLALHSAVAENKDFQLIESLRSLLHHEGYESSELLPANWFYQYVSENAYHIVRETGDTFESFISALDFMRSNLFYSEEDISNMEKFAELKKIEKRQNREDFHSDPSLPENWRTKEIVNKRGRKINFYISPDGLNKFACRRLALIHMITNNFPLADIGKMRSTMGLEGFEESHLLPLNWLIKYKPGPPSHSVHILTDCGVEFKSFSMASEMMMNDPNYTEEDVVNLNKYLELQAQSRRQKYSWSSDSQLPPGWKFRIAPGSKRVLFFLSPDGVMIQGRLRSCIHLLRAGHTEAADTFKRLLVRLEAWRESEHIPSGWLFKEIRNSGRKGGHFGYLFLTREGERYEGCRLASDHIRSQPGYTQQDLDSLHRLVPSRQAQRLNEVEEVKIEVKEETMEVLDDKREVLKEKVEVKEEKMEVIQEEKLEVKEEKMEVIQEEKHEVTEERQERKVKQKDDWAEDNSIPASWRSKLIGSKKKVFLSPDGRQFQSRRTALAHLLDIADTVGEIQTMRRGLASEGWREEGYLPPNWWYRYNSGRATFITSRANLLQSMKEAASYIHQHEPNYAKMFAKFEKQIKKSQ